MIYIPTDKKIKKFHCVDCKKEYSCHSAQNVTQHLVKSHKDYWAQLKDELTSSGMEVDDKDDEEERLSSSAASGGGSASSSSSKKLAPRAFGQQTLLTARLKGASLYRLHKHLVAFLVRDMRAFFLAEGKGFRAFISAINPR